MACTEEAPKTKRLPAGPRVAEFIRGDTLETITPIPYDIIKEGLQT